MSMIVGRPAPVAMATVEAYSQASSTARAAEPDPPHPQEGGRERQVEKRLGSCPIAP